MENGTDEQYQVVLSYSTYASNPREALEIALSALDSVAAPTSRCSRATKAPLKANCHTFITRLRNLPLPEAAATQIKKARNAGL